MNAQRDEQSPLGPEGTDAMDATPSVSSQLLYREVNNHIRALDEAFGPGDQIEVMCECGRGCGGRIELAVAEYHRARREPEQFLVVASHLASPLDRVIEDHGRWLLVEVVGAAAGITRDDTALPAADARHSHGVAALRPKRE